MLQEKTKVTSDGAGSIKPKIPDSSLSSNIFEPYDHSYFGYNFALPVVSDLTATLRCIGLLVEVFSVSASIDHVNKCDDFILNNFFLLNL